MLAKWRRKCLNVWQQAQTQRHAHITEETRNLAKDQELYLAPWRVQRSILQPCMADFWCSSKAPLPSKTMEYTAIQHNIYIIYYLYIYIYIFCILCKSISTFNAMKATFQLPVSTFLARRSASLDLLCIMALQSMTILICFTNIDVMCLTTFFQCNWVTLFFVEKLFPDQVALQPQNSKRHGMAAGLHLVLNTPATVGLWLLGLSP